MIDTRTELWRFIESEVVFGHEVVLWIVADSWGSAPGKRKFKMAVSQDGTTVGTIGGGVMEARVIAMSDRVEYGKACLVRQLHHDQGPQEERSGLICAGGQQLIGVRLTLEHHPCISLIEVCERQGTPATLAVAPGSMALCPGISPQPGLHQKNGSWDYRETVGDSPLLYVVGGGHVGYAIARQFAPLEFRVVVIDDREHAPSILDAAYADETHVVPFDQVTHLIPEGERSFVVVVTRAFDSDSQVLLALAHRNFAFLGLMGSRNKIDRIFDVLQAQGVRTDWLESIVAPMGLPIGNRTPAEIAVSLAAQLIALRSKKDPSKSTSDGVE